jgi:hypothetical protein
MAALPMIRQPDSRAQGGRRDYMRCVCPLSSYGKDFAEANYTASASLLPSAIGRDSVSRAHPPAHADPPGSI